MTLLVNIPNRPIDKLLTKLQEKIGDQQVISAEELKQNPQKADQITMALVWKHPKGSLSGLKNLKAISSFGAGVDAILSDDQLPELPIARIVDPMLASYMKQYVLGVIQHHRLRLDLFAQNQQQGLWKPKQPHNKKRVCLLGLGQLGLAIAKLLIASDFEVSGWSRTPKALDKMQCYSGNQDLLDAIQDCDYLVNCLPLTPETENILNRQVFEVMADDSVLINVARGQHLVESDLLDALQSHKLSHAYLDVFRQEPLAAEHPFWSHPQITITPHVSAITNIETAVQQIIDNYLRVRQGLPMLNTIDSKQGY